jgi:hypothetical protein
LGLLTPQRLVDPRHRLGDAGELRTGETRRLTLTGPIDTAAGRQQVVPSGATAVVLNLAVLEATADGFVVVGPGATALDVATSNLNVRAGETLANAVTVAQSYALGLTPAELTYLLEVAEASWIIGFTASLTASVISVSITVELVDIADPVRSVVTDDFDPIVMYCGVMNPTDNEVYSEAKTTLSTRVSVLHSDQVTLTSLIPANRTADLYCMPYQAPGSTWPDAFKVLATVNMLWSAEVVETPDEDQRWTRLLQISG